MKVVYEPAFHALHLDIAATADQDPVSAYVAGPAAIPAGESTVYMLVNILGDPYLITDSGVQAMAAAAANSTATTVEAASAGDEWLRSRR